MNPSLLLLTIVMTPPFNKPSSSFRTTPSYDNYLLDLQPHIFPYRLPKPLTLPLLPPAPVYLSCWWTGDLTDFWGHFLETTSPRFSEPLSSRCLRGNSKPTTAPMTQWREQFKKKKTIDPLFPSLSRAPLAQPEPPHPPTQCPPPIPQSTHSPSWPGEQTHFPLADQTPFPPGNVTGGTLLQLREVGLELTEEELQQWALDALLCLEDWKWLWELAPAPTPLTSLTPPLPHLPWYSVSNANPPIMSAPNAPNTFAPSVNWPLLDTPNEHATCAPVPYVESSVMWAPVAQLQLLPMHPLPEWLTDEVFESGPQIYDRGNVMVEDPPISFSPFSSADCTMLSHFSFNDFIAVAFPDLAGDLDIQL